MPSDSKRSSASSRHVVGAVIGTASGYSLLNGAGPHGDVRIGAIVKAPELIAQLAIAGFLITSPSAVFSHTSLSQESALRSSVLFRAVGTSGSRRVFRAIARVGAAKPFEPQFKAASVSQDADQAFRLAVKAPGRLPIRVANQESTRGQQCGRMNETAVPPAAGDDERGAPTCHRLLFLQLDPEFRRQARTKMSRNFTRTNFAAANVEDGRDGSRNRHGHEASSCC